MSLSMINLEGLESECKKRKRKIFRKIKRATKKISKNGGSIKMTQSQSINLHKKNRKRKIR